MTMRGWTAGVALAVVVWASPAMADQPLVSSAEPGFVVIVNKDNPVTSLSVNELQRIFRKQSRMWPHAESIVPVDWDSTSEVRQEFSRRVMGRSVREMAEFWVQQSVTQGLAPPSTHKSARAILRFVASVVGAISYVPPGDVDATVKVIKVAGIS